jgi:uncharacterized coiled-coil protein SlyX
MRSLPTTIGGLVAIGVLFVPLAAVAQTTNGEPTTAELQRQIAQLRQSIAKTNGTVSEHTTHIESLTNLMDSLVSKLDRQENILSDQSGQIETLKTGMDTVTTNLRKQIGDQEEILNEISRRGPDGSRVLALASNMDRNPEFRNEVRQVVNSSIGTTGTLEVRNLMDVGKYLKVNEREWYIPARETRTFSVPVGTLTTELVGEEPPRSSTVGPPGYKQRIEISPRRVQQTVQRPINQFRTIERVYVDTPYYVSYRYWPY